MNLKKVKAFRKAIREEGKSFDDGGDGQAQYNVMKKNAKGPAIVYGPGLHTRNFGVASALGGKNTKSKFKGFTEKGKRWHANEKVLVADFSMSEEKKERRAMAELRRAGAGRSGGMFA